MVRIRMARFGTKKRPYYHLMVADGRYPRNGRFLEQVGTYDPSKPMGEATVERERLDYWLSKGAQPSESVAKVLREQSKALKAAQAKAAN